MPRAWVELTGDKALKTALASDAVSSVEELKSGCLIMCGGKSFTCPNISYEEGLRMATFIRDVPVTDKG